MFAVFSIFAASGYQLHGDAVVRAEVDSSTEAETIDGGSHTKTHEFPCADLRVKVDDKRTLGEGLNGKVYRGSLEEGPRSEVAVKVAPYAPFRAECSLMRELRSLGPLLDARVPACFATCGLPKHGSLGRGSTMVFALVPNAAQAREFFDTLEPDSPLYKRLLEDILQSLQEMLKHGYVDYDRRSENFLIDKSAPDMVYVIDNSETQKISAATDRMQLTEWSNKLINMVCLLADVVPRRSDRFLEVFRAALAPALQRLRETLAEEEIFTALRAHEALYAMVIQDLDTIEAEGCSRTTLCEVYSGKFGSDPSSGDPDALFNVEGTGPCTMPSGLPNWVLDQSPTGR